MISFSSLSLKNKLIDTLKKLSFLKGDIEGIEFIDLLSDSYNIESPKEDINITPNSDVCIYVGEDDFPCLKLNEFISLAQKKQNAHLNDKQSYARTPQEIYFLLDIDDYNTTEILYNTFKSNNSSALEKAIIIDGQKYNISLFNGFCLYHLLVEESGNFDEYYPSFSYYDFFIKIVCDDVLNMKIADSLAIAYVFELQSSFNILLSFCDGRLPPLEDDRSTETLYGLESKMFPLICGSGAAELLSLYNTARTTTDINFQILGFTKVIEYISPTISQKELIEAVTLKLTSLSVFKPDATFISELGSIYDKHRQNSTKDYELIKLSICTAVSLNDIWNYIPNFIKGKQHTIPDTEQERLNLLLRICEYVYNTRNEIAHAKANYEKKGTECPSEHKKDFCDMLDLIAVRCIRWFALQPDEKRVVLK